MTWKWTYSNYYRKILYDRIWNRIVNPKTGRKVNVNSKIEKSVLRNYMKQLGDT